MHVLYLLEEEMQLHLENLHNKLSSRLFLESLLFEHECQLLKYSREQYNVDITKQHTCNTQVKLKQMFSF